MVHWNFNAWGEKYPDLKKDSEVPLMMNRGLGLPIFSPGIVLEGGSVEVNGAGTAIVTESCLLNPNRNPRITKEDI